MTIGIVPGGGKNQERSTKSHEAARKESWFELFRVISWIVLFLLKAEYPIRSSLPEWTAKLGSS